MKTMMNDQELRAIVEALENIAGAAKTAALALKNGEVRASAVFFLQKTIDLMQDKDRIDQFKDALVELEGGSND